METLLKQYSTTEIFFIIAGYFLFRTFVSVMAGHLLLNYTSFGKRRRCYHHSYAPGQFKSELKANGKIIILDSLIVAVLFHWDLVSYAQPTFNRHLFTIIIQFVWYELWFYFIHRLLHTKLFYPIHAQHHIAKVAHPMSIISFSLAERFMLMFGILIIPILFSQHLPFTFEGLVIYAYMNLIMNWIGHLNVEFLPAGMAKTIWGKFFLNTPTFHAIHHARYNGHYGLFTPILDRLFNTLYKDYPLQQEHAARGNGPTKLGQRFL